MTRAFATILKQRGVLQVAGPDRRSFLQGIVSNDVEKVAPDTAVWSAFLTPQGKFLHEFVIVERDGAFLLDCEAERLADLKRRLSLYRLRSKVELDDLSEQHKVVALFGEDALSTLGLDERPGATMEFLGGLVATDPRLAELGARAVLPSEEIEPAFATAGFEWVPASDYDRLRISLGVPDGSRDLEVERSILLENGFNELHGVDWDKGCFMGQELTARTKYRGLIKKRLLPVAIQGPTPPPGTSVQLDGKEVGMMRSSTEGLGLATLRLESLAAEGSFIAGEAVVVPQPPFWFELPDREAP